MHNLREAQGWRKSIKPHRVSIEFFDLLWSDSETGELFKVGSKGRLNDPRTSDTLLFLEKGDRVRKVNRIFSAILGHFRGLRE